MQSVDILGLWSLRRLIALRGPDSLKTRLLSTTLDGGTTGRAHSGLDAGLCTRPLAHSPWPWGGSQVSRHGSHLDPDDPD
jgi:hypothetical protein